MSRKSKDSPPAAGSGPPRRIDRVLEAELESFPASDPPAWTAGKPPGEGRAVPCADEAAPR